MDENKKGMLKAQLEHFYYSLMLQGMKKVKTQVIGWKHFIGWKNFLKELMMAAERIFTADCQLERFLI